MADTSVILNSMAGGSVVDTRTEATNGNHRQVVVLGDPATNAGVAPVDATAGLKVDLGSDNDVVLGAGTAAIGKLAANSGVDIGDVDVTSLPATPAGTNLMGKVGIDQTTPGTTNKVSLGSDSVTVDLGANNDVTVTSGNITADTELTTADLDTGAGTDTKAVVGLVGSKSGGGEIIPGSATDGLLVNLGANNDVTATLGAETTKVIGTVNVAAAQTIATTNAGTFAVQAASAGDVAHDSADSGNPTKVGGKAYAFDGTAPGTAVAEGDRTNFIADPEGRQYINDVHPNYWTVSADYAAAQTNVSVKATPGASLSLYITDIMISNGAVAGNITLLDGSGGTVKLEIYPAINGGASLNLRTPIKLTANTALCLTSTTVTTHSITVCGFIAA